MMIKKGFLLCVLLFFSSFSFADSNNVFGQTLQVQTHFRSVLGNPTWLLIVREMETGRILPYQFDIEENNNFWVAFTAGHSYQVTVSEVTFGPYAKIKNFCRLQNGVISGKSMWIVLSGRLTPNRYQSHCTVTKYND